jgi:hypothetical protein
MRRVPKKVLLTAAAVAAFCGFGALCSWSFSAGQSSVKLDTGVVVPSEPITGQQTVKPHIGVSVTANEGEPVVITGFVLTNSKLQVYLKNTSHSTRDDTTVCWKQLDRDNVVIRKSCHKAEESTTDGDDLTDMVEEFTPEDRTVSMTLFVVSKKYKEAA